MMMLKETIGWQKNLHHTKQNERVYQKWVECLLITAKVKMLFLMIETVDSEIKKSR